MLGGNPVMDWHSVQGRRAGWGGSWATLSHFLLQKLEWALAWWATGLWWPDFYLFKCCLFWLVGCFYVSLQKWVQHSALLFSSFFQVLFVNGKVVQVMSNVSVPLLRTNLLLGINGANHMAGQMDEVPATIIVLMSYDLGSLSPGLSS